MKRLIVLATLVASLMTIAMPASAAVRLGLGFGYGYGRHLYVPGSLWAGPAYWNPPVYYVVPPRSANSGELKIDTNAKDASVYIDGAFAGTVREMKTIWLRSGNYDLKVRNTNGGTFEQKVFVPINKKLVIEPVFTAAGD